MKNWLGILVVVIFLGFAPPAVSAETNDNDEVLRQNLLAQIEILQKQLTTLLQLKAELPDPKKLANLNIYKSRFYDEDYEALYFVEEAKLKRRDGQVVRVDDQLLWDAYVDMVGEDFVDKYISEFRVFNDKENLLTGYVDQKMDASWILGINRFGKSFAQSYESDYLVELLIHESAHMPFFTDIKYEEEFINRFWQNSSIKRHERKLSAAKSLTDRSEIAEAYYEKNQYEFVTDYAATSPTEDLVESFVEFVLQPKPNGNFVKDQKVRFFYNYPEMVKWRSELRQSDLVKTQL